MTAFNMIMISFVRIHPELPELSAPDKCPTVGAREPLQPF
jgi:hypothetical protein